MKMGGREVMEMMVWWLGEGEVMKMVVRGGEVMKMVV